ncbi:transposase [Candidatus Peregrinibacteria bacterium]|nr:transposase [Candidatus Peregrinibacteria bacterium]
MEENLFKKTYRIPSIRLQHWDYRENGYYFVTICTQSRIPYFGKLENDKMHLNAVGKMVEEFWKEIPKHFPFVELDEFIVMPEHLHGILFIYHGPGGIIDVDERNYKNDIVRCIEKNDDDKCRDVIGERRDKAMPCLYNYGENRFQNQGKGSLSAIVGSFKSICTREIRKNFSKFKNFNWQPRFYDHLIDDEDDLNNIRDYIQYNPLKHSQEKLISHFE